MNEYPYPFFDEKGKVFCQACGKSYLVISPRHLATHNLTYSDYTTRFPDAPLANKEFAARGKYGKQKDLLKQSDEPAIEELSEVLNEDPEIQELQKLSESIEKLNPIQAMKARILDHLKLHYLNIRADYLISQFGTDNLLKFEFITDFCDPVLKVVIQFPDTFWHNQEAALDPNKNIKLAEYGWKVIEIPSNNPSYKKIDKYIKEARN